MKSKRIIPIVMACTLLGATAFFSAKAFQHTKEEKFEVANAAGEELDLTTVPFSNTPSAGWGAVNINKACDGADLVVNEVTYTKGIGTHIYDDAASVDGDIEYDITSLSTQYSYFEAKVAQVNDGNNCVKFTVLVDDVAKDFIYWRKGTGFGDDNPYYIRCKIANGKKLTLRTQSTGWGMAFGSSAWLEPKLYNLPTERVYASDMLDRMNETNGVGWQFITGEAVLDYPYPLLDERINGYQFSQLAPYGKTVQYKKGLSVHLKNVNYDAYSLDKNNDANFVGLGFNISGMGFTHFNTMAIMGAGNGAFVDAFADGVEIYHSDLVAVAGGLPISFAIPAGTNYLELKVIANNGFGDGIVDLCGACFYKDNEYLYTQPAAQVLAPEAAFGETHGFGQVGEQLSIFDSASGTNVESPKGLFIHKNETYTFDVTGTTYDRLTGYIGCFGPETGHANNNLKVTFTYNDSTTVVKRSETFNRTNSNIPFSFDFEPTGLVSILFELEGELACSASVIHNAKFENRPALSAALEAVFAILQMDKWQGENARASGSCADDFYDARALVLALSAEDLELFKTSEDSYIAAGRARYEAWALALGEQAYADAKLSSNILFKQADMTTTMTVIIAVSAVTCLAFLALALLRKKKRI